MKRIVLSALATSMLAATVMPGMAAPLNMRVQPQASVVHVDWKKPHHRDAKKRAIVKKKMVKRHNWKRGERYREWRKHQRVDWRRHHHLRRPGHGQEWVRVGNDYLLVSVLSGVIAAIVAAH